MERCLSGRDLNRERVNLDCIARCLKAGVSRRVVGPASGLL